jgi:hypothetical protein
VVPRSAEYSGDGANVALLEALASRTGGRVNLAPAAAFDANGRSQGAVREIGLPLLWLALLLLPFDIALRRLLFAPDQVAGVLRRVGLGRWVKRPRTENGHPQGQPRTAGDPTLLSTATDRSIPQRSATQNSKLKTMPSSAAKGQNSELDRLREAQERARRRARGEE